MIKLSDQKPQKCRGIIVWDFDGVLFDYEYFSRHAEDIFNKHGIPPHIYQRAIQEIREKSNNFSAALAIRLMRGYGFSVPEKKIRKDLHAHLAATQYFSSRIDALLHDLRRRHFCHMVLSWGAASYQHKKISIGCGEKFRRHFIKIATTRKDKFLFLKKVVQEYHDVPIFFVDDKWEHIALVKKHLPGVHTIHFTKRHSLQRVRREILQFDAKSYKKKRQ